MTITCPHCGFSLEVDAERPPTAPVQVDCPNCGEPFQWGPEETGTGREEVAVGEEEPGTPTTAEPAPEPEPATETEPRLLAPVVCPVCGQRQAQGERCRGCGVVFAAIPQTPPSFVFAGFWIRLAALLVDSLLVSLLQFVFGFLLLQASRLAGAPVDEENLLIYLTLEFFSMALAIAYFVVFTGYNGQTPGKIALKLRVVRTDGSPVGYGRAFVREVPGKLLSGLLLGIGYLMVAFHPKKQGLHDLLADTYVVKTPGWRPGARG